MSSLKLIWYRIENHSDDLYKHLIENAKVFDDKYNHVEHLRKRYFKLKTNKIDKKFKMFFPRGKKSLRFILRNNIET